MQTQKMSLANIKGKLSRAEMKNIMAGSSAIVTKYQAYCTDNGTVWCSVTLSCKQCLATCPGTLHTGTCKVQSA